MALKDKRGLCMSAVVAVCGANYALMAGDSRLVEYEDGAVVSVVNDETRKVFKLNDSVLLGVTGDYLSLQHIVENIVERDNSALDIATIGGDVHTCASWFTKRVLPLNILLAGKGKGVFTIFEMSSHDGFQPRAYPVSNFNNHQIRLSIPSFTDDETKAQIDKRVESFKNVKTLSGMKSKSENLIKNIASKSNAVNNIVHCETVT